MRKVCAVVTARPTYSRSRSALLALQARPDVELQVIAAASAVVTRFGRVVDQMRADGLPIVSEVSSVVEQDTLANSAQSTGLLTLHLAREFERLKPDVVVTVGDRHETLATAIAASYQHIPLCHVQGGEVTGSIDDKVRGAVTQLADLHFVATEQAADWVKRWNWRAGAEVYVTGCPSIDLAAEAKAMPMLLEPAGGLVVLQHSVTDEYDMAADQMEATIKGLKRCNAHSQAVYFWPGEDAGGSAMAKVLRMHGIRAVRNMPPIEFLRLVYTAGMIVGNSSAGIRECSYLGVRTFNLGTRQRGRERAGNVVDLPHDEHYIAAAIEKHWMEPRPMPSTLYGDGHAGERIAAILAGKAEEAAA